MGVTTQYTYDQNGNVDLINVQGSDEQVDYVWDAENRLIGVNSTDSNGTTQTIEYQYDVEGNRVAKIVNGVETRYLVDIMRDYVQVVEEYTPDLETQTAYVHGLDLISQEKGNDSNIYLYDRHSGVRQLSNGSGQLIETYDYDAYGNLLYSDQSSAENTYLYRGEQFNSDLGLQYLRARYYDPELGRFLSTDLFEGHTNIPISRHRYLYGNDNPVIFSDPSGMITLADVTIAVAYIGFLAAIPQVGVGYLDRVDAREAGIDDIRWDGFLFAPSGTRNESSQPISGLLSYGYGLALEFASVYTDSVAGRNPDNPFLEYELRHGLLALISGGVSLGIGATSDPFVSFGKYEVHTPPTHGPEKGAWPLSDQGNRTYFV